MPSPQRLRDKQETNEAAFAASFALISTQNISLTANCNCLGAGDGNVLVI